MNPGLRMLYQLPKTKLNENNLFYFNMSYADTFGFVQQREKKTICS